MKHCQLLLLLLAALLFVAAPRGGAATLSGVVIDGAGEPLPYAPVQLVPLKDGARSTGIHADSTGAFRIDDVEAGHYLVRVHYVGHVPWEREVVVDGVPRYLRVVMPVEVFSSDDVVVTATRAPQATSAASASIDVVGTSDMTYRNAVTADQALETANGLQVFRSHSVATNTVSIRGSSDVLGGGVGNRVLLLMDGRPALIPTSSGQAWSLLPLGAVERIEVVKGALSALYGSNAMGGVINLITRTPRERSTTLSGRYGFHQKPTEWMQYREGTADFEGIELLHVDRRGDFGYLVLAGRQLSDGHRQSSDYDVWQTFTKLTYNMGHGGDVGLAAGWGKSEAGYPHRWKSLVEPLLVPEAKLGDRQNKNWWNVDINARHTGLTTGIWEGTVYVYGNRSETIEPQKDRRSENSSTRNGGHVQWQHTVGERWSQTAGTDLVYDRVRSDSILYGNRNAVSVSAYSLTQFTDEDLFNAEFGVRYDHIRMPEMDAVHQVNPKLGVAVPVSGSVLLRASAGRAFRAPSIAERFLLVEPAGGTHFVPNDSLRAEKMYSYEVGLTHSLPPMFRLDVAGFVNDYDDWIYWRELPPDPRTGDYRFQVANLLKVRMQGVEVKMRLTPIRSLRLDANYLYLDARDKTTGRIDDVIPYRPKHTFSATLAFDHGRLHSALTVRGRSDVEETVFAAYRSDAPRGAAVTDFHSDFDVRPWLNVGIELDNLFDVQYEEMARFRMPGRTFAATVRITR